MTMGSNQFESFHTCCIPTALDIWSTVVTDLVRLGKQLKRWLQMGE